MGDDEFEADGPDDLRIAFLFIPHGDPEPTEWMARHPGWVKFPATMVPREPSSPHWTPRSPPVPAAALSTAAVGVATPGFIDGLAGGVAFSVSGLLTAVAASFAAVGIIFYPSRTAPPELDELPPEMRRRPGQGTGGGACSATACPGAPGPGAACRDKDEAGRGRLHTDPADAGAPWLDAADTSIDGAARVHGRRTRPHHPPSGPR